MPRPPTRELNAIRVAALARRRARTARVLPCDGGTLCAALDAPRQTAARRTLCRDLRALGAVRVGDEWTLTPGRSARDEER